MSYNDIKISKGVRDCQALVCGVRGSSPGGLPGGPPGVSRDGCYSALVEEAIRLGCVVSSVRKFSQPLKYASVDRPRLKPSGSGGHQRLSAELSDRTGLTDSSRGASTGLVVKHINDRLRRVPEAAIPESKVVVMKEDVVICRRVPGRQRFGGGRRGKITRLTRAARRRLLLDARNVSGITGEATLTYPGKFPTDGRKVKRDCAAFRKMLARRGIGGMWFLEFQVRGAPHFHLFLNGRVDKSVLSESWYRIVGSDDQKHLIAGTRVSRIRKPYALAMYAAKYAGKYVQKVVPAEYSEVGRFWGRFGGLEVESRVAGEGSFRSCARMVRIVRGLYVSKRRLWRVSDGFKKFRDCGNRSFIAWSCGPGINARGLRLKGEVIIDDNGQFW